MEALGIVGAAAAIIQLAGVGMALAKSLYAIYDEGASGPERLKELYTYVQSTSLVLEEIGKVFEEEGHMAKPLISATAIAVANDVVARCSSTFDMIHTMADDAQRNTMGLLVFSLKGTRLRTLQGRLDQSKIDLQLMLQVIIYARITKSQSRPPEDEKEQRQVVEELLEKRNQPLPSPSHVGHNLTLATDTSNIASSVAHSHRQTPLRIRRPSDHHPNPDGNALSPAEEDISKDRSPPSNAPDQSKPQTHPSNPIAANPGPEEWGQSYLSALYFVCCPCRPRRKPVAHLSVRLETMDSPQVLSEITELRVNDRANDLPMADPEAPASNRHYSYEPPTPVFNNSYDASTTESTTPSLDESRKKQDKLDTIAKQSASVRDVQSEVDRLLHLWTTIYDEPTTSDVPSTTIQSASEESPGKA